MGNYAVIIIRVIGINIVSIVCLLTKQRHYTRMLSKYSVPNDSGELSINKP